jgi:integrase
MPRYVEPKSELAFRNAKTGPKPYLLPDGQGLSLRTRPNGAKTWLLRYRRPGIGKENFLTLGPYPDVGLTEARRRADTARDLVREGIDPVEQRRADIAARKRAADGAFHLVAKAWLEFKRKEWADETYCKAEFVLRVYLTPALRNKSISTLSTAQVKPILETIAAKAPNLASKARQYVGGIVSYAIHNNLREDGLPLALRGVLPRHKKGHIPAITKPADIGPLVKAINAYSSPITRAALKLAMLAGLRPGVIASAPRSEIDLDAAEWHIPGERMKMRHDHIVPPPRQALVVLNELKAITGDSAYIFPSPTDRKLRICTATLSARRCAIWCFRASTQPTAFGACSALLAASGWA